MEEERMYENMYPEIGSCIIVKVIETNDSGSIVECIEYPHLQGLIPFSMISKKRIHNISKLLNIGKQYVAEVSHLDTKNNYIDLSKKNVTQEEAESKLESFERYKKVHSIIKRLAFLKNEKIYTLNVNYTWKYTQTYGHPENVLKDIAKGNTSYDICIDYPEIIDLCKHAYKSKPVNIVGKVELNCFGPEGIDAIKRACNKAKQEFPSVLIYYQHSPYFIFHMSSDNIAESVCSINEAMELTIETIQKEEGGRGNICQMAHSTYRETWKEDLVEEDINY